MSDGALDIFVKQLGELVSHSGNPTLEQLSDAMNRRLAPSSIQELLKGRRTRPPQWDVVSRLVEACVALAEKNHSSLTAEEADTATWYRRHQELLRLAGDPRGGNGCTPSALGELPDEELGAPTPLGDSHPYIPRPVFDERLASAMHGLSAPYPYLVTYGSQRAGKTTSVIAGVRRALPAETAVHIPKSAADLRELARMEPVSGQAHQPSLIWLDRLASEGIEVLSASQIDKLASWAVIVCTISSEGFARILETTAADGDRARAALGRATLLYLPAELTDNEITEAIRLYPGMRFRGGIAAAFTTEADLRPRFNMARDTNPAGWAIIQAAIDSRRAGLRRPIRRTELFRLAQSYLANIGYPALTGETFDAALSWALKPIAPGMSFLLTETTESEGPDVKANEDLISSDNPPLPDFIWTELTDMCDADESYDIGLVAASEGQHVHAASALSKAAEGEDPAGTRTMQLGMNLYRIGDYNGAEQALEAVIAAAQPDTVGGAHYTLALIYSDRGDVNQARKHYAMAVKSGDPRVDYPALRAVAFTYHSDVTNSEFRELLTRAAFSPNPRVVTMATLLLGAVASAQGNEGGALGLWEEVQNADDQLVAMLARVAISDTISNQARAGQPGGAAPGTLAYAEDLANSGQLDSAVLCYLQAQGDNPSLTDECQLAVGTIYEAQERQEEARHAYETSMAAGTSTTSGLAAVSLGALHLERGDKESAVRSFEFALTCKGKAPAQAAVNLGLIYKESGDVASAKDYFERAQASGFRREAAKASLNLAGILEESESDPGEVDQQYKKAAAAADEEFAPIAAAELAARLMLRERTAEALEFIHVAEASTHLESKAKAAWLHGLCRQGQDDFDGAMSEFRKAIGYDIREYSLAAHGALGWLLAERDDPEAEEHLKIAYESSHPKWAPRAGFLLGAKYWFTDRYRMAEPILTWVLNSKDPDWAGESGLLLGEIYKRTHRNIQARWAYQAVIELGDPAAANYARQRLREIGENPNENGLSA